MFITDVNVINKKGFGSTKEFAVDYCEDFDSVVAVIGNKHFSVDYRLWKEMNRFLQDKHDGDLVECDGNCEDCEND